MSDSDVEDLEDNNTSECDSDSGGDDDVNKRDEIETKPSLVLTERESCLRHYLFHLFKTLGLESLSLLEQIVAEKEENAHVPPTALNFAKYIPSLRGIERFFARMSWCDEEAIYWKVVQVSSNDDSLSKSKTEESLLKTEESQYQNPAYHVYPIHVFDAQRRIRTMWQERYLNPFGRHVSVDLWRFSSTICQAMCIGWMIHSGLLARLQYLEAFHPISLHHFVENEQMKNTSSSSSNKTQPNKANAKKQKPSTTASRLKSKSHDACVFEYPALLELPASASELEHVPLLVSDRSATKEYYEHILKQRCCKRESIYKQKQDDASSFKEPGGAFGKEPGGAYKSEPNELSNKEQTVEKDEIQHLFDTVSWDTTIQCKHEIDVPPIFQPEIVTFAEANTFDEKQLKQIFNVKQTRQARPKIRYNSKGDPLPESNHCDNLHVALVAPVLNLSKLSSKALPKGMSKKRARALHLQNLSRFYWDQRNDWNAETGLPSFFDTPRDVISQQKQQPPQPLIQFHSLPHEKTDASALLNASEILNTSELLNDSEILNAEETADQFVE